MNKYIITTALGLCYLTTGTLFAQDAQPPIIVKCVLDTMTKTSESGCEGIRNKTDCPTPKPNNGILEGPAYYWMDGSSPLICTWSSFSNTCSDFNEYMCLNE